MEDGKCKVEKMKVMIAIDGSDRSHYALQWAIVNLHETLARSELFIFTVQTVTDSIYAYVSTHGFPHPDLTQSILENQKKAASALLDQAKGICAKHGIVAETVTDIGDPKEKICEAAEKINVQLLILGSHSRGTIKKVTNVSKEFINVIHSDKYKKGCCLFADSNVASLVGTEPFWEVSATTVFTMPNVLFLLSNNVFEKPYSYMEKPKEKTNKVMVAIGDDDHSYKAFMWTLDYVKELSSDYQLLIFASQPLPANLTYNYTLAQGAFGVHHSVLSTPELMTSLLERKKKVTLDLLEKAKKICSNHGVRAETITEFGEPKEVICNIVQKHNINLLVIGNNGDGSLKRAFLGSLSDYCANNAKCPVLVVN